MTLVAQEEDSTQVKPPTEFKASPKWKPFKEGCIAYFNLIKTRSQIPLAYVIRELEVPDPYGKVFDYLKSLMLNGPEWTWMRTFNQTHDGGGTWLALLSHYKEEAQ
jgi:hypothetical protein